MSTTSAQSNSAVLEAKARAARLRRRLIGYGQWEPHIPAEPVRTHMRALAALGMSRAGVERALGLRHDRLRHLMSGAHGYPPAAKIEKDVGQAVLGFWPKLENFPDTATIEPTGTRRRVEALAVVGWSRGNLARRAGRPEVSFRNSLNAERVTVALAKVVARLYDELWKLRPEDHGVPPHLADRVRRQAEVQGFYGPLAWDDETIDNPSTLPMTDAHVSLLGQGENLATRFLLGESVILDAASRREVLAYLMEWTDLTVEQVAERLETTPAAVSRMWERIKEKARKDGRAAPWRRVYVPQRELLQEEAADAA
ncbi:hypothetical protein [Streptomyces sp. NPDC058084]|uniref:hypothetical protein n=1 Tax=Streptomyces sp. NPDC058084 TaxID=3346333 RepID=UPI0036E47250